jgi:nitrite reductase/ring-hydroxylating ferredoxin subunit
MMDSALVSATPVTIRPHELVAKDRYIAPEFAAIETERLWPRVWQIACHKDDVGRVGDFFEFNVGDQPLLIVRSSADTINAYYNTCLHRGSMIKNGAGNARELRCPYHGWRWNLDGSIKEVTDRQDFVPECIEAEDLQLPQCRVETWAGFVFINLDLDAQPLQEYLDPVAEMLSRFELDEMRLTGSWSTVLAANWKTTIDAFNETYHAQGVHPESLLFHDDTSWTYHQYNDHAMMHPRADAFGRPSPRLDFELGMDEVLVALADTFAQSGLVDGDTTEMMKTLLATVPEDEALGSFLGNILRGMSSAQGIDMSELQDSDLFLGESWCVFPNAIVAVNGTSPVVWRARPNGDDPESCIVDTWTLRRFGDGTEPPAPRREHHPDWRSVPYWPHVWTQDMVAIPRVQRGMHARTFAGQERLGRQDANILHFHQVLDRYVAD